MSAVHNYVDITGISPQYLVLEVTPMPAIGLQFATRTRFLIFARENRSRRKLHAKEKGKEAKETLTVSETLPRTDLVNVQWPLERSTFRGAFSYLILPPQTRLS